LLGELPEDSKKAYAQFVARGIGEEPPASIKDSVRKGVLGSEEFIARIKKEHLGDECSKPNREKPQLRKLRTKLDLSQVLSISEKVLGARNKYLVPVAVLISHKNSALKLKEIGEFFSLSISTVSNACSKARAAIASNAALASAMEEIEQAVVKAEENMR
jgi:hypothetical protein